MAGGADSVRGGGFSPAAALSTDFCGPPAAGLSLPTFAGWVGAPLPTAEFLFDHAFTTGAGAGVVAGALFSTGAAFAWLAADIAFTESCVCECRREMQKKRDRQQRGGVSSKKQEIK